MEILFMESRGRLLIREEKNKKTDKSKWQRVENAHEPIIDKDTFYRVQERIELIRSKHLEGSKPNPATSLNLQMTDIPEQTLTDLIL